MTMTLDTHAPQTPSETPAATPVVATPDAAVLEQQAAMILSAMDAAARSRSVPPTAYERRGEPAARRSFRGEAKLRLFADRETTEPWPVFLRDIESRAIGFITPDRLPLGYGGRLTFIGPDQNEHQLEVTVVRCRSCYGGWYEGAAYFHRSQPAFRPNREANLHA
jgi:hypothetical protein